MLKKPKNPISLLLALSSFFTQAADWNYQKPGFDKSGAIVLRTLSGELSPVDNIAQSGLRSSASPTVLNVQTGDSGTAVITSDGVFVIFPTMGLMKYSKSKFDQLYSYQLDTSGIISRKTTMYADYVHDTGMRCYTGGHIMVGNYGFDTIGYSDFSCGTGDLQIRDLNGNQLLVIRGQAAGAWYPDTCYGHFTFKVWEPENLGRPSPLAAFDYGTIYQECSQGFGSRMEVTVHHETISGLPEFHRVKFELPTARPAGWPDAHQRFWPGFAFYSDGRQVQTIALGSYSAVIGVARNVTPILPPPP